jgi:hypothetical protein
LEVLRETLKASCETFGVLCEKMKLVHPSQLKV